MRHTILSDCIKKLVDAKQVTREEMRAIRGRLMEREMAQRGSQQCRVFDAGPEV
jgi:hypothetical protein